MTRKEAIETLKNLALDFRIDELDAVALEVAIKALEDA